MTDVINEPLDPSAYFFWHPPTGMTMTTGEDTEITIPDIPLPIKAADMSDSADPTEKAIGDGIYEYLCQFSFCPYAADYANILQEAFPFLISDIASQLILLDVKNVESEGQNRKISLLNILHHIEPENFGLMHKIGTAHFDLALNYTELTKVKPHLAEARTWLEKARRLSNDDVSNLNLLGQVCYLMGSYHQSRLYWKRAVELLEEGEVKNELQAKLTRIESSNLPDKPLAESLEFVGAALEYINSEEFAQAREIMENLEAVGDLPREMPNPEFFYLLGLSREKCDDPSGAYEGYEMALSLDKNHQASQEALGRVLSEQKG